MYILVEIIHTEFQYISLIEIQKYNWNRKKIEKRKTRKKRDLLSRLVISTGTKGCASHVALAALFARLPDPGQKDPPTPLLSRPGVPGWETVTTRVSQPEQISVSVAVHVTRLAYMPHPLCHIGPHSTVTVRIVRTFEGHRTIANFNSSKSTVFIFLLKKHDQRRAFYCLIGSCDLFALLSSPLDELCTCVDTLSSDTFLQKKLHASIRVENFDSLETRESRGERL